MKHSSNSTLMASQLDQLSDLIANTRDELYKARKSVNEAQYQLNRINGLRRSMMRQHRRSTTPKCSDKHNKQGSVSRDQAERRTRTERHGRSRQRSNDHRRIRRSRSRSPRRMTKCTDDKDEKPTILVVGTPKSPPLRNDLLYFRTSNPVSPSAVIAPCPELPNSSTDNEEEDWNRQGAFQLLDEILCEAEGETSTMTETTTSITESATLDDRIQHLVSGGLLKKVNQ